MLTSSAIIFPLDVLSSVIFENGLNKHLFSRLLKSEDDKHDKIIFKSRLSQDSSRLILLRDETSCIVLP